MATLVVKGNRFADNMDGRVREGDKGDVMTSRQNIVTPRHVVGGGRERMGSLIMENPFVADEIHECEAVNDRVYIMLSDHDDKEEEDGRHSQNRGKNGPKQLKSELDTLLHSKTSKRRDSYGYLKKKLSTESILDDMSHLESSLYSLNVYEPQHYTNRKRAERRKRTNIVRMLAGIPFAVLYGVFMYLVLRFMILSDPREHIVKNQTANQTLNTSHVMNNTDNRMKWREKETVVWFGGEHRPELIYASAGFTVVMSLTSVLSRGTRCTLMLIMPCVITGRSRAILFTFTLGLLIDGPIESIVHNFNEITRNTACVYGAVAKMAHASLLKLNSVFRLFNQFKQTITHPFMFKIAAVQVPYTQQTTTAPTTSNLTFPRITAIQKQITMMKRGFNEARKYSVILRKTLTVISIILAVLDAVRYLRLYYSDNSYDNMYVNRNVRHFWKRKGYANITPLRRWEENEGFKASSGHCTHTECKKSFRRISRAIVPTLIFALFVTMVMISDYLLADLLQSIKDKEDIKISISMKDIEAEFASAVQLILKRFYAATDACEVHPLKTSINKYVLITLFLFIAGLSCIFEVILARVRARMCNIFYNHRARERADYLHYRLTAGRISRRIQLRLIIRREIERRRRLEEFSLWKRLTKKCRGLGTSSTFTCPGCGWNDVIEQAIQVNYQIAQDDVKAGICRDCYQDFKIVTSYGSDQHVRESYFVVPEKEG